ncbi:MAG: PEP-CTERM sorting domain-containing protein [Pirellulaceae bacterium]
MSLFHFFKVFILCALLALPSVARADLVYTFSGVIPVGASDGHSIIGIGDTWTASFVVDENTPSSGSSFFATNDYAGAAKSGTISFSSGVSRTIIDASNRADYTLYVMNDGSPAATDSVFIYYTTPTTNPFSMRALDFNNPLSTRNLPGLGVTLTPSPSTSSTLHQLSYTDANGVVVYDVGDENNITFSVSAVPEPSSFGLFLIAGLLGLSRRRP